MFKKTIRFIDFNDQQQEKDFYFHMSKSDLLRMAANGTMEERIKRIIATNDQEQILKEFEDLIRLSVGERSEDGQTFDKSSDAQARLMFSPAYDELLLELCTDATAATDFVQNLLPEKMQKEMADQLKRMSEQQGAADPFEHKEDARPRWMREHRQPTPAELSAMSQEELRQAWAYREQQNKDK